MAAYLLPVSFTRASLSIAILAAAVGAIAWRSRPQACTSFWNSMLADGGHYQADPMGILFACVGAGNCNGSGQVPSIRLWQVLSFSQFPDGQDVLEVCARRAGFS